MENLLVLQSSTANNSSGGQQQQEHQLLVAAGVALNDDDNNNNNDTNDGRSADPLVVAGNRTDSNDGIVDVGETSSSSRKKPKIHNVGDNDLPAAAASATIDDTDGAFPAQKQQPQQQRNLIPPSSEGISDVTDADVLSGRGGKFLL